MANEYYRAYEERYRAVRDVTDGFWGHGPESEALKSALGNWVAENCLSGKRVIEFACGEGAGAMLLSDAGCIYTGTDIAPTAIEKARRNTAGRENVSFVLADMVKDTFGEGLYDGAADISGLHMLVTDPDRETYLKNVYRALKPGGYALFWQESYRSDAYEGTVTDISEWAKQTGLDFDTPELRNIGGTGKQVWLKLLPARPRTEAGYRGEMEKAGFVVDEFGVLADDGFMVGSAFIKVHRPM